MRRRAAGVALLVALSAGAARADPRLDYMLQCRGCHGPDGAGVTGAAPSLRRLGRFVATPAGRDYLIRVPGVSRSELDDAALAALLNWLLRDQPLPPDFVGFQPDEVAAARRSPLTDVVTARRAVIGDGQ
ncbi:MAG: cytochrome c [Deltaproteobacteria bacterium]|nr:cytochrome c [Deltaproteobacteria bacterium]